MSNEKKQSAAQPHFHPKGKSPTAHTAAVFEQARRELPFSDTRDLDENQRGLIARMDSMQIKADAGHNAWDMSRFSFLDEAESFDSIHPSLVRQAKLNQNYGLYEVTRGIYQVRGLDLSQMSFVRGKSGWILFDVLVSAETARAALALFRKHVGGDLPVTAVVYSHNHVDHWGGVKGVVDEADVKSGRVEIIAPVGFMANTIAENVYAGNAMNRRANYQYGLHLPVSPYGYVSQGLGQATSRGSVTLIPPTRIVALDYEEFDVDGVRMIFQNTPDTEAPSEMNTYLPEYKALWMAENISHGMHNIYTLRGAPVRDALRWSQYINNALYKFGPEAEVMFAAHHWPRWGNKRIQEVLSAQRDLYANLHNQVLHLANNGVTINRIHNVFELPESLQKEWHLRGYHGSLQHNVRGVVQRYLGYWDCNPATLIPPSPEQSAPLYVRMMGGASKILAEARSLFETGDYMLAVEILNKLVYAEPTNNEAKDLLADSFEQIGYQQENPGLRNSFLAGAYELRSGAPTVAAMKSSSADVVRAMPTDLFLNFLGVRLDSRKAEHDQFTINLVTPDNGEMYAVELRNATLTNIKGFQHSQADLTLTIARSDLELAMMGAKTPEELIASGVAKVAGDISVLKRLGGMMDDFDPTFEIMPGTKQDAVHLESHKTLETADMGDSVPE